MAAVKKTTEDQPPADEPAVVEEQAPADEPDLFAAALEKAPHLTREFVEKYGLDDEWLAQIARGELSPPPTVGPEHTVDLHYINGGWQITPVGVKPEDAGKDAIAR